MAVTVNGLYDAIVAEVPARRLSPHEKRARFVSTARQLFHEHGFQATTVDDIARASGLSARTFFRYFGTKEDVLFEDIRDILDELRNVLASERPTTTRWNQIRGLVIGGVERLEQPAADLGTTIAAWLHEPVINGRFREYLAEMESILAESLKEDRGQESTDDYTPLLRASVITAITRSALKVYAERGGSLRDLANAAFDYVERGNLTNDASR